MEHYFSLFTVYRIPFSHKLLIKTTRNKHLKIYPAVVEALLTCPCGNPVLISVIKGELLLVEGVDPIGRKVCAFALLCILGYRGPE